MFKSKVGTPYFGKTKVKARETIGYDAEAAIKVDDQNEIHIGVKIKNDDVYYVVDVPLKAILYTALTELKDKQGMNKYAQHATSALVSLGRQLCALVRPPPLPKDQTAEEMAKRFVHGQK